MQTSSSRSNNVVRNIAYGFINRFFSLSMPFIVRTIVIYRFGAAYLGMNSFFASIFQVLNLAELGFSTAVVYSLYRPIARGDTDTVCAYLGSYRKIYRIIGCVILLAGLSLIPTLPHLLKNSVIPNTMNLYVWYLLFLADAVTSYLLFGYKTAIPSALQRNDLISRIDTIIIISKATTQIFFLLTTDNFYLFLLTSLFFTVLRNLFLSRLVEKYYPHYVCRGHITKPQFTDLKQLVYGLMLSKIRVTSRHGIDNICITAFIGLTMTAIYDNYFTIFSAVISIFAIFINAMTASVGNSIATESTAKTYQDMRRFNFMYMLLAGWATISLLCLFQPFVMLWVGPNLMLNYPEVIALCLYFYIGLMGDIRWVYFQGAGLWWKERYFAIAELLCNIILNILLGKYWGIMGIILATLITLFFIHFISGTWILFNNYFQNNRLHEFFADHFLYFCITAPLAVLCIYICEKIPSSYGIIELPVKLIICTAITILFYHLVYYKTTRYQEAKHWLLNKYHRKEEEES